MAYRRRQQATGVSERGWKPNYSKDPLEEEVEVKEIDDVNEGEPSSTSLAAKAIRASSASQRDSSLSSAYGFNHRSPPPPSPPTISATSSSVSSISASKDSRKYEYTSVKSVNEPRQQGFWGSLARKAKSFLDDDNGPDQVDSPGKNRQQVPDLSSRSKYPSSYASNEVHRKMDTPKFQKGLNAISSSLNYIGNVVEEGLTVVENRTADIIQETRKNIQKKPSGSAGQNQGTNPGNAWQQTQMPTQKQPQIQTDLELQLKASRDVAMAMAAKAKLLLRELKTVKADLAFAKERCAQLEDENRILRENRERGGNLEDDDMIRLQLETLLAEKARLAHENSVYARENRFLREVVEYHQLTMQDVVYLDESTEEVTEVYPIKVVSNSQPISPTSLDVSSPPSH